MNHVLDGDRIAQTIYAADSRDNDNIPSFHQRKGCGQPQTVYLVIYISFLFDIQILAGHIGFRLVVIICRDEVFDSIVGKEALELPVQLGCKRLVV